MGFNVYVNHIQSYNLIMVKRIIS